jgi:hypothetical protein
MMADSPISVGLISEYIFWDFILFICINYELNKFPISTYLAVPSQCSGDTFYSFTPLLWCHWIHSFWNVPSVKKDIREILYNSVLLLVLKSFAVCSHDKPTQVKLEQH